MNGAGRYSPRVRSSQSTYSISLRTPLLMAPHPSLRSTREIAMRYPTFSHLFSDSSNKIPLACCLSLAICACVKRSIVITFMKSRPVVMMLFSRRRSEITLSRLASFRTCAFPDSPARRVAAVHGNWNSRRHCQDRRPGSFSTGRGDQVLFYRVRYLEPYRGDTHCPSRM